MLPTRVVNLLVDVVRHELQAIELTVLCSRYAFNSVWKQLSAYLIDRVQTHRGIAYRTYHMIGRVTMVHQDTIRHPANLFTPTEHRTNFRKILVLGFGIHDGNTRQLPCDMAPS